MTELVPAPTGCPVCARTVTGYEVTYGYTDGADGTPPTLVPSKNRWHFQPCGHSFTGHLDDRLLVEVIHDRWAVFND